MAIRCGTDENPARAIAPRGNASECPNGSLGTPPMYWLCVALCTPLGSAVNHVPGLRLLRFVTPIAR